MFRIIDPHAFIDMRWNFKYVVALLDMVVYLQPLTEPFPEAVIAYLSSSWHSSLPWELWSGNNYRVKENGVHADSEDLCSCCRLLHY